MRLSLVPLLVGTVVRPCVCFPPLCLVTWEPPHHFNGITHVTWVMIH